MERKKRNNRISVKKRIGLYSLFLCLAIFIEIAVSFFIFSLDQEKSAKLFLNQIENVLDNNEKEEKLQLGSLKETYITAAQAAAYIIDGNQKITYNIDELKNVASLLNVDELHIFDDEGTIISGTVPEYYGFDFSSGDQIGYFKPMLKDRKLTMCQDVTPNTAEGKSMMYAIAWDTKGKFMVQVGVEPTRLLEMLKDHEIENVVESIPITSGYDIYAIDAADDTVVASSVSDNADGDTDNLISEFIDNHGSKTEGFFKYKGELYYVSYRTMDDYLMACTYNVRYSNSSLFVPVMVIFIYLLIAVVIIALTISKSYRLEDKKNEALMKQYNMLSSMADIYYSVHLVDLENDTYEEYKSQGAVKELSKGEEPASVLMKKVITNVTADEYVESALEFTNLSTVAERMLDKKNISAQFVGKNIGWFRATFIVTERDEEDKPVKVIYTTLSINAEKKKEERLIFKSNTDELTGCYNRRAYENSLKELERNWTGDDFVYISVDVNGLKATNDSRGHDAGDELIIAAAECMNKAFAEYGKVFRIGGDEFVAFIWTKQASLEDILGNLDSVVEGWQGELVDKLSLSYGYVKKSDMMEETIHEIAKLADKKMYEAKSRHYRETGVDRRGQRDAHKALCALYTKILKVNFTEDTYQIVNMNEDEKTDEKGYASKISEWLLGFGKTGQVHPDDLRVYLVETDINYIRTYFSQGKKSLHIFYRRRYDDGYRRVMMEIVPANDYTAENQSCYLYVKDIDTI